MFKAWDIAVSSAVFLALHDDSQKLLRDFQRATRIIQLHTGGLCLLIRLLLNLGKSDSRRGG